MCDLKFPCRCGRVDVLVFDTQGRRHNLRGREGQLLVDLLAEHEEVLGSGVARLARLLWRLFASPS